MWPNELNKGGNNMTTKYTKITVYGQQVRVAVKAGEFTDDIISRAAKRVLREEYGNGARLWGANADGWNEYAVYYQGTVVGRSVGNSSPVLGTKYWSQEVGTDTANKEAIIAAGGRAPRY